MMRGVWRLDLNTKNWSIFTCKFPPAVWFHAVSVTPEGCMFSFGGCETLNYEGEEILFVFKVERDSFLHSSRAD
jgi:hypothetical protein